MTLALLLLLLPPAPALACEMETLPGDHLEFTCPLPAGTRAGSSWRFVAELSGGHDDSHAFVSAWQDEMELPCEPGTKTRTEGEDGDITLECRFLLGAAPTKPLKIKLKASHVRLERASLTSISRASAN